MLITLYKNCILTDSYSEVFDVFHKDTNGKTPLERYLATLEHKDIIAGDVYVTGSGKISFMLTADDGDFYQYNYMRVVNENNGFARYCFIDMITCVNNVAVVSYIEDVWSNYASTMHMRKSLLTRSRILDYGFWKVPFYALGMDYEGNNQITFKKVFEQTENYAEVAVVMQVQLYKLTEQGKVNERVIYEFVLQTQIQHQSSFLTYFPVRSADEMVLKILQKSSGNKVTWNGTEWNYEIYNITYIPKTFNVPFETGAGIQVATEGNLTVYLNILVDSAAGINEINYTNNVTLPANFKQFKIGTLLNAFDIVQNGTPLEIKVGYFASKYSFTLVLSFQNQVYDITSDFTIELPVTVQTADVTQQQATAREVAQLNAKLGIASGAMQIAGGVADVALGATQANISSSWGKQLKGAGQITSGLMSVGGGIMNIISSRKKLEVSNRAMFVSNKGTKVLSNASLISTYGIVLFEIQPDNEVEVKANIDNGGYVCNEIVDDILQSITTGATNKYNVMSFEYVNIFGKFPQQIANTLREILYGGFKIWYDETAINE